MNDTMRGPVKVTHWTRPTGYIKGQFRGPVCGIDEKVDGWRSVNDESLKDQVTCEHCLYWLWDQEQPAKKLDVSRAVDDRVVNMQFNNGRLSAHDAETAIQRGIREGLAKVASDFRATKPELQRLVEDGVQAALQRSAVRTNLVGIHKIADDEIESEYEGSEQQSDDDEARLEDMKTAVRVVLAEQEAAGNLGKVEFTQNVYSPEALSPSAVYRQGRNLSEALATSRHHLVGPGVGTQVINVNAEVDPESFKDMVKDAAREYDEETLEDYNEEETALMQKAVTSIVTSDEFQGLMKKVVKVALDEREQEAHRRALEWQIAWSDRYLNMPTKVLHDPGDVIEGSDHNAQKIGIELKGPDSYIHFRRLYKADTACYLDANKFNTTQLKSRVTCQDCKDELNNN